MRKFDRNFPRREILTWSRGLVARGIAVPGTLNAEADAAGQDAPVTNYRVRRREYIIAKVGSYSFQVEKSMQTAGREIAQKALDRFVKNINKALEMLPMPASAELRNFRYFVMRGPKAPGRRSYQRRLRSNLDQAFPAGGAVRVEKPARKKLGRRRIRFEISAL